MAYCLLQGGLHCELYTYFGSAFGYKLHCKYCNQKEGEMLELRKKSNLSVAKELPTWQCSRDSCCHQITSKASRTPSFATIVGNQARDCHNISRKSTGCPPANSKRGYQLAQEGVDSAVARPENSEVGTSCDSMTHLYSSDQSDEVQQCHPREPNV